MATAFVKVRKVGGSLVTTVPKEIREGMNLHENEIVKLEITKPGTDFFGALKGIGSFTKDDEYDIDRIIQESLKSAIDKTYIIEDIVKDLCEEREDQVALLDEIVKRAAKLDIDENLVDEILYDLKIKGLLFELKTDKLEWIGPKDTNQLISDYPSKMRMELHIVGKIIKGLCEEKDDKLAPLDEILEKAAESKIAKNTVKKFLNELEHREILIELESGKWKWINSIDIYEIINEHVERMKNKNDIIEKIIKGLCRDIDGKLVAPLEKVIEKASESGIDRNTLDKILVKLKQKGKLLELERGKLEWIGPVDITEYAKTERDKIFTIENVVKELCQEREDRLAPLDEIIEKAAESKIDKEAAEKILNELKIKGILFEPRKGKWKWVG